MGTGFSEAPLAIFTTLAPMGAMAFVVLLMASIKGLYEEAAAKRIDRMSIVPAAVVLVGFVGAFFHLANPLNAVMVFDGVGRSPLSNELVAGCIFFVAMLAYVILAWMGKLSDGLRKGFLAVLSVLAIVFAVFCGLACMMGTIPAWNQPSTIVQMLGFALLGGAVLGCLVLALAKVDAAPIRVPALAMAVAGLVLAVAGFGMQLGACATIFTIWGSSLDAVPAAWIVFAALFIGSAASCVLLFAALKRIPSDRVFLTVAVVLVVAVVFFARIAFYGLHVTL